MATLLCVQPLVVLLTLVGTLLCVQPLVVFLTLVGTLLCVQPLLVLLNLLHICLQEPCCDYKSSLLFALSQRQGPSPLPMCANLSSCRSRNCGGGSMTEGSCAKAPGHVVVVEQAGDSHLRSTSVFTGRHCTDTGDPCKPHFIPHTSPLNLCS